ncbi:MAG: Fic family protein [Acidobacteria bacterium]|nr:Fic family protein [Acidobacteriota bacterium]
MRSKQKSDEIQALALQLLDNDSQVSIRAIAAARGKSKDDVTERRAIRRALVALERKNLIAPKGEGRSRVYVPKVTQETPEAPTEANPYAGAEGILSSDSKRLLKYISKPLTARTPVGYDQEFLRAYEPNKTFYLTADQRNNLQKVGQVEAVVRPAGTYAKNILNRLLIDLSWNSSRLEGNTYSLLETKRLIELGETADGRDLTEAQMILNHKAAIEYIVESAEEDRITFQEICSVHALLSENLLGDASASGRLRTIIVGIAGTTYLPLENAHLIRECLDLFIEKVNEINDPFEQSLFSIVHLSYLQAFEDVNKRTGRLVANIPLIRKNLKPLSFTEVQQSAYVAALLGVYERNDVSLIRDLYVWAYTRSSQKYTAIQQSMGEPNVLKLKYRSAINDIVRSIILEQIPGPQLVRRINESINNKIPEADRAALFNLIETEFLNLHEGNIARFKVLPSEFQAWKELQ